MKKSTDNFVTVKQVQSLKLYACRETVPFTCNCFVLSLYTQKFAIVRPAVLVERK